MENRTIYGYTLLRKLETGTVTEVWYAENSIGKAAAVKILSFGLSYVEYEIRGRFMDAASEWFENEARLMVRLIHPNIRQVYYYGMLDDRPYIVMEYLDGEDLGTLIENRTVFTQPQIIKWWNQLVSALMFTHQHGIVHRDIKPSNIFITKEGNVKLMDFSNAMVVENYLDSLSGIKLRRPLMSLDEPSECIPNIMYASPEQLKSNNSVDYRSDFYSLAVTFVHLLSGKAPYSSLLSDFSLYRKIIEKPLDIRGIPQEWQGFLENYLAKKPEDRPVLREFEPSKVDSDTSCGLKYQNEGPDDIYVSSAQISMAERIAIYQSSPQIRHIFSKPTGVMLALMHDFNEDSTVAVITIEDNNFDLGVFCVSDGIIEELYLSGGNDNYIQKLQSVSCSAGIKDWLIVSNGTIDQGSIKKIESILGICPKYYRNLNELLVSGAFVYSGVLKGTVRDVLLLSLLPNSLYCETLDSVRFDLIQAETIVPARDTIAEITIKTKKLFIKENGHNEPLAVIQLKNQSDDNRVRRISVETDIDSRFRVKVIIKDLDSEEKYEAVIGR